MNKSFRRFFGMAAALLMAGLATRPAPAALCALDNVPAATLLLPHFEVDSVDPGGIDTVVRIQNATAEPTLVHLTLWSEWSQPVIDFDIYLTGYDVVSFRMIDMFGGNIPITADQQSDPGDFISPHGGFPEWEGSFPPCHHFFPFFINPVIRASNLERVRSGLTGKPVAHLENRCLGPDHGDNIGRGYITFDTVSSCSTAFPIDVGYFFDGGTGIATDHNRIFGDWQIVDPDRGIVAGGPLVSIEADPEFDAGSTPTGYTFYGTALAGSSGRDNREPLGAAWSYRFASGAAAADPFTATELIVWRDTTSHQYELGGFDCAAGPSWDPLDEETVTCFDEQENAVELCGLPGEQCFPLASQRLVFDQGPLTVPYSRGFCQIDLNNPNDNPTGDRDYPPSGRTVQQSHVSVVRYGAHGIGAAQPATAIRHTCQAPPP
jgi:hypothetical protein